MKTVRSYASTLTISTVALCGLVGISSSGCAELTALLESLTNLDPNNADPNSDPNNDPNSDPNDPNDPNDDNDATARAVFFIQGREIDGFSELNVTVSEVSFIGGGSDDDGGDDDKDDDDDAKDLTLSPGVRINLLAADVADFIACLDDAPVGDYTKLRLSISDPEFVQTNGTVIDAADIKLTGNGKLDLNTQGGKFTIQEGIANFIVFTLQSDDNALKVTETGNGVFNLRSQAFVDAGDVGDIDVALTGVVQTTNDVDTLVIASPECDFAVIIGATTQITLPDGAVGTVADIDVGETISIVGEANDDESLFIAVSIRIQS